MNWPLVTRARYELLREQYERLLSERNAAFEARDRALDQLINRIGFEPISAPVRAERKEQEKELDLYLSAEQFEDIGSGMIDESILKVANELGDKPS